jgi:hypothetical protein
MFYFLINSHQFLHTCYSLIGFTWALCYSGSTIHPPCALNQEGWNPTVITVQSMQFHHNTCVGWGSFACTQQLQSLVDINNNNKNPGEGNQGNSEDGREANVHRSQRKGTRAALAWGTAIRWHSSSKHLESQHLQLSFQILKKHNSLHQVTVFMDQACQNQQGRWMIETQTQAI